MDFTSHFRKFTIKHSNKINLILQNLRQYTEINHFCYYTLSKDGSHSAILSNPELAEYYSSSKLFKEDSFLSHPDNFSEGTILWSSLSEHCDDSTVDLMLRKFNMSHGFTVIIKPDNGKIDLEAFSFAAPVINSHLLNFYVNERLTFAKFCSYFKNEATTIINEAKENPIDLASAKGAAFNKRSNPLNFGLSNKDRSALEITMAGKPQLRLSLSKRENECLNLCLRGKSARQSAEILGLSTRTVEHYLESVKNKYGCDTKSELFESALRTAAQKF